MDPVDMLLASNSLSLRSTVIGLAFSAVVTTIIGSLLALGSLFGDLLGVRATSGQGGGKTWLARGLTVIPPLMLAMSGPRIYYAATEFAGAYPVTILWGVMPPLMLWMQLQTSTGGLEDKGGGWVTSPLLLVALAGVAVALLTCRVCADVRSLHAWAVAR